MSLSVRRPRSATLLALLSLLPAAAGAQSLPTLHISDGTVTEADAGTTPMVFDLVLSQASGSDVTFEVRLDAESATEGVDYEYAGPLQVLIPAGTTFSQVTVPVVGDTVSENDETFWAQLQNLSGAQLSMIYMPGRGTIIDDDAATSAHYLAFDDRFVVAENTTTTLPVLGNDTLAGPADGTLTVLFPPEHGTATVRTDSSPAYIEYQPDADFSGEDHFSYRYCDPDGAGQTCDGGEVDLVLRPLADVTLSVAEAAGFRDVPVTELRALPSARFVATPLVAPRALAFDNGVDPTPETPWDTPAGTTWDLFTLPAPGPAETLTRIIVDEPAGLRQELRIAVDTSGNGEPDAGEPHCTSAHIASRCEIAVPRTPGESVNYWVMVHNLDDERRDGTVRVYEVPMMAPDGSLQATGAGHVERGEDFPLRLGYVDDTLRDGGSRAGYVTVYSDDATAIGEFPVIVRVAADGEPVQTAVPLVQGVPHEFSLGPAETHELTFVDVPAGATRLRVTSQSDQNVDLYLIPSDGGVGFTETDVPPSPPLSSARVAATGPTGNEVAEVTTSVTAGRWHVTVRNASAQAATYVLTAQIDATAPIVRDGSYFNADRSGSGLFLYPAADQWTGLWYAYLHDGTPTWYYLQATQPGADGVWSSPIYRSSWDGSTNGLVAIGDAVVTPVGGDRFRFSYRIDGETGTQVYESFGRGCPFSGTIDLSGTWFDPARAGTGYSVQFFPDYEYYAAYYYDDRGYARFVAAELGAYGGSEADLVIQQLAGDCPTCAWTGLPDRTDIGVLRRRILSRQFQYIDTDLEFVAPLSGGWTTTDTVELLGGPGTTQGCAP